MQSKTVKFYGEEIELPWQFWEGVRISPAGLRTKHGIFRIENIEVGLWHVGNHHPRMSIRMIDNNGQEVIFYPAN